MLGKTNGGLITKTIPLITSIPHIALYIRILSFKQILANIIVGRTLQRVIAVESPKGINETAINPVILVVPPKIERISNKTLYFMNILITLHIPDPNGIPFPPYCK